jgi:hypothetical protein
MRKEELKLKMGQKNYSIAEVMVDSQYLNASTYMTTAPLCLWILNLDHSYIYTI